MPTSINLKGAAAGLMAYTRGRKCAITRSRLMDKRARSSRGKPVVPRICHYADIDRRPLDLAARSSREGCGGAGKIRGAREPADEFRSSSARPQERSDSRGPILLDRAIVSTLRLRDVIINTARESAAAISSVSRRASVSESLLPIPICAANKIPSAPSYRALPGKISAVRQDRKTDFKAHLFLCLRYVRCRNGSEPPRLPLSARRK